MSELVGHSEVILLLPSSQRLIEDLMVFLVGILVFLVGILV